MSLDDFSAVAMFPTHSPRFEPLRQSDDCESFLELKDNSTTEKSRPQGAVSSLYVVLTVLMTCIASLMLGIWAGTTLVLDADKFCIKRISQHCKFSSRIHSKTTDILSSTHPRRHPSFTRRSPFQRLLPPRNSIPAPGLTRSGCRMAIPGRGLYFPISPCQVSH